MRIGMLGTGTVGQTLTEKLTELGHDVKVGSRDPGHPYADAAAHGELVFNATAGGGSLEALAMAGGREPAREEPIDVGHTPGTTRGVSATLLVGQEDPPAQPSQRAHPGPRAGQAAHTRK